MCIRDRSETVHIVSKANPSQLMKAIKNEIELENTRKAHLLDGIAVTKFMYWLKKNVGKIPMDEVSVSDYLQSLREQMEGYRDISFDTIAGYNANAAMMHYKAEPDTAAKLEPQGMLLVDSGGHYDTGTTDITRTFAVSYTHLDVYKRQDMGRTSRQREVIDKMLQQAKVASPSALLTAVRYACPNINTTLSNDELFALAADVNSYSIIDTEGFPYTYDLTLGTLGVFGVKDSLVCTDLAGDVKKLHTYLFGDDGYEPSQTVKDISYTIQKAFGVGQ